MLQPGNDTLWGSANTVVNLASYIFYVFAEHGKGIMIPKEKAPLVISSKAISMGAEDHGYLYYRQDENADIPIFEILKKRLKQCREIELKTFQKMKAIREDGHICLSSYFGECPQPENVPATELEYVRNGIYFVGRSSSSQFAIYKELSENYLSPVACEFGRRSGDYLYYDLVTSAIPLHELSLIFDEVDNLIISRSSLYATIRNNFRTYLVWYNSSVEGDEMIPESHGQIGRFLQRQLGSGQPQKKEKY